MSRFIGLDHGSRRIGVAVGDTETGMAFARPALHRRNLAVDLDTLAALAQDEDTSHLIVGLPRNLDGSEGPQAGAARAFGDRLSAMGFTVEFVDERLTSWQAEEALVDAGRRPDRSSGELDSAAARLILQEYLDALARRRAPQTDAQEAE